MRPKAVSRWQRRGLFCPQLLGPSPGPSPLPAFLLTLSLHVPNLAWFLFHHPAYLLISFRSPGHTEFSLRKYTEAVENLIRCLYLEITSCDGPIWVSPVTNPLSWYLLKTWNHRCRQFPKRNLRNHVQGYVTEERLSKNIWKAFSTAGYPASA